MIHDMSKEIKELKEIGIDVSNYLDNGSPIVKSEWCYKCIKGELDRAHEEIDKKNKAARAEADRKASLNSGVAEWKRLPSGSWGIKGKNRVEGHEVKVKSKDGRVQTGTVGEIIEAKGDLAIAKFVKNML